MTKNAAIDLLKPSERPPIQWKLHLEASQDVVFKFLNTQKGREQFWAESAPEKDGIISFQFINGQYYHSKILDRKNYSLFKIEYFNSIVTFHLENTGIGGTDLTIINQYVIEEEYLEVYAGWVSVLMALKGAVDFGIDLRNHDKSRTWDELYVDN